MASRRLQRPHHKYYLGEYYKTCWFCGAHGHYKEQCKKRQSQSKANQKWRNNKSTFNNLVSKKNKRNSNDVNIVEFFTTSLKEPFAFHHNRPGKGKLA